MTEQPMTNPTRTLLHERHMRQKELTAEIMRISGRTFSKGMVSNWARGTRTPDLRLCLQIVQLETVPEWLKSWASAYLLVDATNILPRSL